MTTGSVAALALLAGCGGGAEGTPTPAPTNSSSSPGSSATGDTTEDGAPRVKNPLEYATFESAPCSVLTAAQLGELGMPSVKGEDFSDSSAKMCEWNDRQGATGQTLAVAFVSGEGGLNYLYRSKASFKLFEPTAPIEGYPALLVSPADQRTDGDCALSVGITDTKIVTFTVQMRTGAKPAPRFNDPCGVGTEFARKVVGTIKGGS